ncbi:calcium/proton exchanger, partial [Jimgerdemannia flammicorona]
SNQAIPGPIRQFQAQSGNPGTRIPQWKSGAKLGMFLLALLPANIVRPLIPISWTQTYFLSNWQCTDVPLLHAASKTIRLRTIIMSFATNDRDNDELFQLSVPKKALRHTGSVTPDYSPSVSDTDHLESSYSCDEPASGKRHRPATVGGALRAIVLSSYVNLLVVFIPLGIISHFLWNPTATFILNFLAIIPLAKLLGFATEDLAIRVGETLGGLLNATFGNAVELIISVIALTKNLVRVVQASMLGSILSNLLLVLGFCFFCGGLKYKEQEFNITAAQTSASLMAIATCSLLLPAAFYSSLIGVQTNQVVDNDILAISHATAFSPAATEESQPEESEEPLMPLWMALTLPYMLLVCLAEGSMAPSARYFRFLFVITVLVAICAEFLVGAIDDIVTQWHLTETFVGLILLPIVGNAAEHVTAVTVALKNKMDLAIGVAIGSSMQIALLVTPLMVIIGWGLGVPMTLYFNVYETAVMFISVLKIDLEDSVKLSNYPYIISHTQDGKSNWLEGLMLLGVYVIIAISFFYYPDVSISV